MHQNFEINTSIKTDNRQISWDMLHTLEHACSISQMALLQKVKREIVNELQLRPTSQEGFTFDLRDREVASFIDNLDPRSVDLKSFVDDAKKTYYFFEYVKALGDTTYPENSDVVQKHLFRMQSFLRNTEGEILDIGCNLSDNSITLFSSKCTYTGCDPFIGSQSSKLAVCFAEELPFKDNVYDVCVFNTSLDHVFDYYEAFNEAFRVTRSGGSIIVAGYIWLYDAVLTKDHVHFHHFRLEQILAALSNFGELDQMLIYECPKKNKHRQAIYLKWRVLK